MVIDVDKDPQKHSIEFLRARYIGRYENTVSMTKVNS